MFRKIFHENLIITGFSLVIVFWKLVLLEPTDKITFNITRIAL